MKEEAFILLWLTTTSVVPTGKINNLFIHLFTVLHLQRQLHQ